MDTNIENLHIFIKKNFLNKMKMGNFQFTKPAEKMMKQIYSHLLKAETEWLTLPKIQVHLPKDNMFTGSAYTYIPQEIRTKLESSNKVGYSVQLHIGERKINVKIVFPISNQSPTNYEKESGQMIHKIYLWLFIADKYACKKCSKEMDIFLFMTDDLKILPDHGHSIDKIHANTAFTTPCSHSTDIHLFRREEWFKVLIHETFHNLGLDFSTMDQSRVEPHILTLFPLNIPDIRIYESYCETWAELLNIMFTAYWSTKNKRDVDAILDKMEKYLDLEQVFSMFQSTKVLHHYQLTYDDIYQNREHSANLGKVGQYNENTNAFSYFILKPILLFHLNEFIQWTLDNNDSIKCHGTMDFKKTQANIMQYAGLIKDLYDSPEYVQNMAKMDQLYRKNQGSDFRTLRMSIVG